MGTHMWTGVNPPVSRRGRRMSLELPPGVPPIPLNPKDAEFLQQRQRNLGSPPQPPPHPPPRELSFFPYLPTPFSVAAAAAAATTTTTASAATNSETAVPRTSVSIHIVPTIYFILPPMSVEQKSLEELILNIFCTKLKLPK